MKLEDKIKALITQYQNLQKRHKLHAENAYYKFQADMWQAMSDDFGIIVEDLELALFEADDVECLKCGTNVDPRKTAPAGKWCADSAAQAADSAAKEARNNG